MTEPTYVPTGRSVHCGVCRSVLGQVWRAESATKGVFPDHWHCNTSAARPESDDPKIAEALTRLREKLLANNWNPRVREEERLRTEARRAAELAERDRATGWPAVVLVTDRPTELVGDTWQLGVRVPGARYHIPLPAKIQCRRGLHVVAVRHGRVGWKAPPLHTE